MATLRLRMIAADCLGKFAPLSIKKDILMEDIRPYFQVVNKTSSLREQLDWIQKRCIKKCTINGSITGEIQYVSAIGIYSHDNSKFNFEIKFDDNGRFSFSNLLIGDYKVSPLPSGKFDVLSEPREQDITCREGESHIVNFHIVGAQEG